MIQNQPAIAQIDASSPTMTPSAVSLAKELDLVGTIQRIRTLKAIPVDKLEFKTAIELLSLTQSLDYKLTITSLEIADVLSEIDSEDARADELRSILENRRTDALKLNSYANLIGSGALGIVASSVGISNNQVGNILGTTDGSVNATLATAALRRQRDAGNVLRHSGAQPNMLAAIFDQKTDERTAYPPSVWNYLNQVDEPGELMSRREKLVRSWVSYGRISSPKSAQSKHEITLLTGTTDRTHDLTIRLLDDRSAMLSDLRAVVSTMNRSLLKLMLAIKSDSAN